MTIEIALEVVFSNLCVNGRNVQFHYGTQMELIKWMQHRNIHNLAKFPLIWYVSNEYSENNGLFKVNNARLVLFMNTKYEWLNAQREQETFSKWIYPLYEEVKKVLARNLHVRIYGKNDFEKYKIHDVRNFGVSGNGFEPANNKSIATDFVDAKYLDFDFEINVKCLTNNL